MLPVWLDDSHIGPSWIRRTTGLTCRTCSVQDISNEIRKGATVRDGATLKLTLEMDDDDNNDSASSPMTLIIKQIPPSGRALSQQLGLAREALFYQQLATELPEASVPKIYYAAGDMAKGTKVVIMQDLSSKCIDSGVLFGPGNPNNWNRDCKNLAQKAGNPSSHQVALITFQVMARIHAIYWRRTSLLEPDKSWLRGQAWLRGQNRDSWEASQQIVRGCWARCQELETSTGTKAIHWDAQVKSAVAKAVQGISWEAQQKRLHIDGHWTLVHGDFWPGNVMWMIHQSDEKDNDSIRMLDWEMVGLGSGPQELGQYVISNMDPIERKECEWELVQAYYQELKQAGVNVTWDYCWSEYMIGGVERWMWFLVYFVAQEGMSDWAQFFHDQIAAFMQDHGLSTDIVQPRP